MQLCVLQSGTGALDISTHSPSADLLPGGSPPLASLDLVIKYITEMRAEMREIKETMRKLVESHLRMEQQLLESVNNIEAQPPCIMQSSSISLAQSPRHLELGSNESVYQTCPHSRTSSKGDHDLIATRVRHNSLPPTTLHLLTDSKQQLVDRQTSPTSKDHKLDYVLEESTDISTQVRQCSIDLFNSENWTTKGWYMCIYTSDLYIYHHMRTMNQCVNY